MKHLFVLLIGVIVGKCVIAQHYAPKDKSSEVKFSVENFGFTVDGSFSGLNGDIAFDENNLSASSFKVSINSASVNTSNNTRDKHLRGEVYFNTSKFETIEIVSSKIAKSTTAGYYVLFTKLTIKGVTKDISFPFKAVSENGGIRFTGSFKIKRRDFGVGGRNTISNDVDIKLNVFAKKL